MSLVTLSMTASTYLFFQHDDYISFDRKRKTRTPGLNDPSLISIAACTLLYIMVNAPRIFANALILSVSPQMAILMMLLEFGVNLFVCEKLALSLKKNAVFPSGFISAAINYACPCYPITNLGQINLFSTSLIILKVIALYPILYTNTFTLELDQKPNILQCWNVTKLQQEKGMVHVETYPHLREIFSGERFITCDEVQNLRYNVNETSYFNLPRFCACDEDSNDVLFHYTIPIAIIMLCYSILFGLLITIFIRKRKLNFFQEKVSEFQHRLKNYASKLIKCCNCCKDEESLKDVEEMNITPQVNMSLLENHRKKKPEEELPWWIEVWSSFLLNVRTIFDFSKTSGEDCKYERNRNSWVNLKSF